jgi:hypothetical protein
MVGIASEVRDDAQLRGSRCTRGYRRTGGRCGPSQIDALLYRGRLLVTYSTESTQRLTIRSWSTTAL